MADKPVKPLGVFTKTETDPAPQEEPAAPGPEMIDLEALIKNLGLTDILDDGIIQQTGVGLRGGEMQALKEIGAELGGVARNALLRTGARLLIALYKAGRLDLTGNVEEPPPQKKRFRQPGSKK